MFWNLSSALDRGLSKVEEDESVHSILVRLRDAHVLKPFGPWCTGNVERLESLDARVDILGLEHELGPAGADPVLGLDEVMYSSRSKKSACACGRPPSGR